MPTINVLSKNKKNIKQISSENYHFYSREILQYIARTCVRNALSKGFWPPLKPKIESCFSTFFELFE